MRVDCRGRYALPVGYRRDARTCNRNRPDRTDPTIPSAGSLEQAFFVIAEVIKYTWPVQRMRRAEVRTSVLVIGAVAGIVGFFVIPVIGLLIGFVLGVFAAELAMRRETARAWASTVHALKGVALSVGVELTGALLATVTWVVGVLQNAFRPMRGSSR